VKASYQLKTSTDIPEAPINNPLSIDLIRKLKRPGSTPKSLLYTSSASFQGTALEDWLMQTLDEYITSAHTPLPGQTVSYCKHVTDGHEKSPVASFVQSDSEEATDEQSVVSYQVDRAGSRAG
jgi:hypothetical protein